MRLAAAVLALVLHALALSGCGEREPEYESSLLKFDQQLAGTWKYQDPSPGPQSESLVVRVEPRSVDVSGGRVKPFPPNALQSQQPQKSQNPPNAFVGTLIAESPDKPRVEIECVGFVLQIDHMTLAAFQPSRKQMGPAADIGMLLPVQQVLRIERSGDSLRVWAPKTRLGWLPDVSWLDAPAETPETEPQIAADSSKFPTLYATSNVDRFVAALRKYGSKDEDWEEIGKLQRVK